METSPWVEEKLMTLNAGRAEHDWQPNAAQALSRIHVRQQRDRRVRARWVWASATVLAGGLSTLAFPAPRAVAERVWAPCVGACESFFAGQGIADRGVVKPSTPAVGDVAPDFTLSGSDGAPIRLSSYRGKMVLLNFWATWCPPCRAEIPWFVDFERTYGPRGLAVIGVSMDQDGWKAVRPFQRVHGIQYALGIGDSALARKFGGVESLPQTLLIDRDGRIAAKYSGIVSRAEYENAIGRLLAE